MSYFFSMIRFVPDAARGEFINLGALAGDADSGDWDFRLISNFKRARAIDAQGLLPAALRFAGELQERLPLDDDGEDATAWTIENLQLLSGEMNNLVQLSAPTPVVADSAERALDIVFDSMIFDPASQQFRFEKKHRAVRLTRQAYRDHEVPAEAVKERVRVVADRFNAQFDFAVHNGSAVQLVQCWSFQLPNQQELAEQVKAWAWVVGELRGDGGYVVADGAEVPAPAGLEVASVYVPPRPEDSTDAFSEAQAAFEELGVVEHTPEDADVLGAHAVSALQAV
ncbi:MAG TPA: DUF3037 domain-containing protein [Thermoleophilaceae bacterium]|jgi:hypothetical protein